MFLLAIQKGRSLYLKHTSYSYNRIAFSGSSETSDSQNGRGGGERTFDSGEGEIIHGVETYTSQTTRP